MDFQYSSETAKAALGQKKAPLVLKNARVVQVFTNEILTGDIAIADGVILGVGEYQGEQELDMAGKYVCPGFIDAHLHLESTLVNPGELILQAGLKGTTTFVVDPHEAANVSGREGIDFILRETEDSLANVYVMVPSCVPSGPFEDNGYALEAEEMETYLGNPRILGLGEVMDCQAVLSCDEKMLKKLRLFREKMIDGHGGYLGEKETGCYALAGIHTDHECCTFEDALRELRAGIQILIREGTAAKNLESIIKGVVERKLPCHQLAFCTDDKHIEDIQKQGHISYNVKKAIGLGLDPIEAIKIATLYPARRYGLNHLGAIAPGYQADLVVFSDLHKIDVTEVYYRGQRIRPKELPRKEVPASLLHTVHIKLNGVEDFRLPLKGGRARVVELVPGEILTREIIADVQVKDGCFAADETYQKLAVLERHHATGKKGLGIVKGCSLSGGAIASTVGHDSHNLIVAGTNDADMVLAGNTVRKNKGGLAFVLNGRVVGELALPVAGLMSMESAEEVEKKLQALKAALKEAGISEEIDAFMTLAFVSLPVIPKLRLNTYGVVDVEQQKIVPAIF